MDPCYLEMAAEPGRRQQRWREFLMGDDPREEATRRAEWSVGRRPSPRAWIGFAAGPSDIAGVAEVPGEGTFLLKMQIPKELRNASPFDKASPFDVPFPVICAFPHYAHPAFLFVLAPSRSVPFALRGIQTG